MGNPFFKKGYPKVFSLAPAGAHSIALQALPVTAGLFSCPPQGLAHPACEGKNSSALRIGRRIPLRRGRGCRPGRAGRGNGRERCLLRQKDIPRAPRKAIFSGPSGVLYRRWTNCRSEICESLPWKSGSQIIARTGQRRKFAAFGAGSLSRMRGPSVSAAAARVAVLSLERESRQRELPSASPVFWQRRLKFCAEAFFQKSWKIPCARRRRTFS